MQSKFFPLQKQDAATAKKEAILEAKEESHRYRESVEQELKQRRNEVQKQEDRLLQRGNLIRIAKMMLLKSERVLLVNGSTNLNNKLTS